MATMKCKTCNRIYNYRSSELCPKCGAYNRPPHRMEVEFDNNGNAVLNVDKDSPHTAYTTTESKFSYAEQARKVRDALVNNDIVEQSTLDALGNQMNKWGGRLEKWWRSNSGVNRHVAKDSPLRDRRQGKSSGAKAVAITVAVSILASLLGTIMNSCESNRVHVAPEPDDSISVEQVAPSDRYWSNEDRKMILDAYAVSEEVGMTEVFEWRNAMYWVGAWQLTSGGNGNNVMILSVNGNEFPEERLEDCFLLWVDWDGTEWVYHPESFQNGALIFRDLHATSMPEDTLCWLFFNDYDENDNWIGTTAVSLVEHDTYFSDASQDLASVEGWTEEGWKDLLSYHDITAEYSMGSGFMWQGSRVEAAGWEKDDGVMSVSVTGDHLSEEELLDKCYLLWFDTEGEECIYHPHRYEDGALIFSNIRDQVNDTSYIWLVMMEGHVLNTESNTMENLGTTAVRLN